MAQCIDAVQRLSKQSDPSKQPVSSSQAGNALVETATSGSAGLQSQGISPASSANSTVILPRPSTGTGQSGPPSSVATQVQPKKRGRPSRADKAKRNLHPILPPRIAPRPPPVSEHRAILPAISRLVGSPAQSQAPSSSENPKESDDGKRKKPRLGVSVAPQQNAQNAPENGRPVMPPLSSGAS